MLSLPAWAKIKGAKQQQYNPFRRKPPTVECSDLQSWHVGMPTRCSTKSKADTAHIATPSSRARMSCSRCHNNKRRCSGDMPCCSGVQSGDHFKERPSRKRSRVAYAPRADKPSVPVNVAGYYQKGLEPVLTFDKAQAPLARRDETPNQSHFPFGPDEQLSGACNSYSPGAEESLLFGPDQLLSQNSELFESAPVSIIPAMSDDPSPPATLRTDSPFNYDLHAFSFCSGTTSTFRPKLSGLPRQELSALLQQCTRGRSTGYHLPEYLVRYAVKAHKEELQSLYAPTACSLFASVDSSGNKEPQDAFALGLTQDELAALPSSALLLRRIGSCVAQGHWTAYATLSSIHKLEITPRSPLQCFSFDEWAPV